MPTPGLRENTVVVYGRREDAFPDGLRGVEPSAYFCTNFSRKALTWRPDNLAKQSPLGQEFGHKYRWVQPRASREGMSRVCFV
eukprot:scaffold1091_cov125-Isochrysis_galbana.AAC.1